MGPDVAVFVFLSIGAIALFSFIAVSSWADARRSERVAYYENETIKKIAESPRPGADAALGYLREQEKISARKRRDGRQLGGLIAIAVGIGLMVFLHGIVRETPVYLVGLIPLLIGAANFSFAYFAT